MESNPPILAEDHPDPAGTGSRPDSWIHRPSVQFWGVSLFFASLWIIFPTLFIPNYRLDIVEQFFVGREWTPGSGSHPALTAIVLDVISTLTGRSLAAPYIASALFILLTLWSIWRLAREYLSDSLALIAVFAMFNYWYCFQMEGTRYNNSVTLDAFWALGIWVGFKAMKTRRLLYWFGTGVVLGIGCYFKYTEIVLALLFVLFLTFSRYGRRLWRTPGPWISTLTAFLIFLPYLLWLMKTGYFHSMTYAVGNAPTKSGFWGHFLCPLEFLSNQIPLILPPIIALIPVCGWIGRMDRSKSKGRFEDHFLTTVLFGALAFNLVWSAVGGVFLRCDLGCHLWTPLTVYLLYRLKTDESERAIRWGKLLPLGMNLLILVAVCVGVTLAPLFEKKLPRYHFPGQELAEKAEAAWREDFDSPLPWVTGEPWSGGPLYEVWPWLAGNVSVYGKDRARVYSGPNHCSWGTPDDLRREGGLFLWTIGNHDEETLEAMRKDFPNAELKPPILLTPKTRFAKVKEIQIGVALIPPEKKEGEN